MKIYYQLFLFVFIYSATMGGPGFSQTLYKWVDKNGTVHFADSLLSVPPEYRNQVKKNNFSSTKSAFSNPSAPVEVKRIPEKGSNKNKNKKSFSVPFEAYEGRARRVIVQVKFNGRITAPMVLDTGAPGMVITTALAKRLGLYDQNNGRLIVTAGGIGGSAPAFRTIVDSVQIGGIKELFVPTTITDIRSQAFDGLIGMDFMGEYDVQIDNKKQRVTFTEMLTHSKKIGGHGKKWWKSSYQEFNYYRQTLKAYRKMVKEKVLDAKTSGNNLTQLETHLMLVESQIKEATKLFEKLDIYAAQNAVPKNWRVY